jgi:hypothetical protein
MLLACSNVAMAQVNTNVNVNVNTDSSKAQPAAAPAQQQQTQQDDNADDADFHPVEIGVRFMPTFSSFGMRTYDNGVVQGEFTLGYGFGGLLGVNFNRHIGLQAEFIYNSMSQKYRDRDYDRVVTLNYVNIPLLLSLNTGKGSPVNLNIVAGPQVGINVGSKLESSGGNGVDTVQAVLAVKSGDVGVAYGAGLEFGLGEARNVILDIGFRGVYGLVDISDRSKSTTTNEYYVLDRAHVQSYAGYIGLKFAF